MDHWIAGSVIKSSYIRLKSKHALIFEKILNVVNL